MLRYTTLTRFARSLVSLRDKSHNALGSLTSYSIVILFDVIGYPPLGGALPQKFWRGPVHPPAPKILPCRRPKNVHFFHFHAVFGDFCPPPVRTPNRPPPVGKIQGKTLIQRVYHRTIQKGQFTAIGASIWFPDGQSDY